MAQVVKLGWDLVPRKRGSDLTWQDIKRIVNLADEVINDVQYLTTEEAYYTEVLKRFNDEGKRTNF